MQRNEMTKSPNRFRRLARYFFNALAAKPDAGGTNHGRNLQLEFLESREVLSASPIGPEFELRPDTNASVISHDVAMVGDGGFIATWSSSDGVFTQRYGADNQRVGTKTTVGASPVGLSNVRIAANAEGRYAVVWTVPDGSADQEIRYAVFNEQGSSIRSGQVNTTDGGHVQSAPRVAMDQAGNFTVAFVHEYAILDTDVYYRRFDRNGVPFGNDAPVPGAQSSKEEQEPAIAMSPAGRTVIAWTDRYYSNNRDVTRFTLFDESGTVALADASIAQVNIGAVNHRNADVAIDRNGDIYFAWVSELSAANANEKIVFSIFGPDGVRRNDEYWVSMSSQTQLGFPTIEPLAGGGMVIAYTDSNGSNDDVWVTELSGPRTLAWRNIVDTDSTQNERSSRLAANGKSYVVSFLDKAVGSTSTYLKGRIYQGRLSTSVGGFSAVSGEVHVAHAHPGNAPVLVDHLIATLPTGAWTDMLVGHYKGGDAGQQLLARDQNSGQWWFTDGTTTTIWNAWAPTVSWVDVKTGDFNGDGKTDIVGRWSQAGQWWVGLSTGTGLTNRYFGAWSTGLTWIDVLAGDFNRDGATDIVGRWKETGQWWMATTTGSAFTMSYYGAWSANLDWVDVMAGDVTGDGRTDVVGRWKETGQWWVAKSTGSAFTMSYFGAWSVGVSWVDVRLADVNGDNVNDLLGRAAETGQWYCGVSTKAAFQSSAFGAWSAAVSWVDVLVGDFNGDGKEELIGRDRNTGIWWAGISTGKSFRNYAWGRWAANITWSFVQTVSY